MYVNNTQETLNYGQIPCDEGFVAFTYLEPQPSPMAAGIIEMCLASARRTPGLIVRSLQTQDIAKDQQGKREAQARASIFDEWSDGEIDDIGL